MQRRSFLSIVTALFASGLPWKQVKKTSNNNTLNTNHSSTPEGDFVIVNNWFLKKEDLKNT